MTCSGRVWSMPRHVHAREMDSESIRWIIFPDLLTKFANQCGNYVSHLSCYVKFFSSKIVPNNQRAQKKYLEVRMNLCKANVKLGLGSSPMSNCWHCKWHTVVWVLKLCHICETRLFRSTVLLFSIGSVRLNCTSSLRRGTRWTASLFTKCQGWSHDNRTAKWGPYVRLKNKQRQQVNIVKGLKIYRSK